MAEALLAAGPLIGAAGAITQGKMTSQSLNAQAQLQDTYAAEAQQQGAFDAQRQIEGANRRIGTSIAAYGASGVSSSSGSIGDVIHASAQNAEIDRLNILHGADLKAINFQNQAAMDRYGAESALKGSYWTALGDVVGGAGKVAGAGMGGGSAGGAGALNNVSSGGGGNVTAGEGEGAANVS